MASRALQRTVSGFMFFALFLALSASDCAAGSEPSNQVVGFYSHGALQNATALQQEGYGYFHLFQSRNRFWGSMGLVALTESVAAQIASEFPEGERLLVGDISAENGGKITLHGSHQNGLDIDYVYFRADHQEQEDTPEVGFTEFFVQNGKLTKNFDRVRNWRLFELLVESGRVQRIFLDPAIKAYYCRQYSGRKDAREVLRRLRPLSGHADHTHVRLTCPVESTKCTSQEEVPSGVGC